mgnify:CR=1 FL=1
MDRLKDGSQLISVLVMIDIMSFRSEDNYDLYIHVSENFD